MNVNEAIILLKYHALREEQPASSTCEAFLHYFRTSHSVEKASVHEIMSSLNVVAESWGNQTEINREVISCLIDITFISQERLNDSYLNHHSCSKKDYDKYSLWIECISRAVMCILSGMTFHEASLEYRELFLDENRG